MENNVGQCLYTMLGYLERKRLPPLIDFRCVCVVGYTAKECTVDEVCFASHEKTCPVEKITVFFFSVLKSTSAMPVNISGLQY